MPVIIRERLRTPPNQRTKFRLGDSPMRQGDPGAQSQPGETNGTDEPGLEQAHEHALRAALIREFCRHIGMGVPVVAACIVSGVLAPQVALAYLMGVVSCLAVTMGRLKFSPRTPPCPPGGG